MGGGGGAGTVWGVGCCDDAVLADAFELEALTIAAAIRSAVAFHLFSGVCTIQSLFSTAVDPGCL